MSILGIDVGNTHAEVGLFKKGKLMPSIRLSSTQNRTEDEMWFVVEKYIVDYGLSPSDLKEMIVSSVVPGVNFILEKMAAKYLKKSAIFVNHEMDLGLKINYQMPYQVGADRLCNAVAGYKKYPENLIILDFGTATTFDIIFAEGTYEGGIISSGLESTNWGLHERAAKLPRVKLEFPESVIGKTTESAIQSGLMYGITSLIDGLILKIKEECKRDFRILSTGGLASIVIPYLQHKVIYEPTLLMDGLYEIYRRNC